MPVIFNGRSTEKVRMIMVPCHAVWNPLFFSSSYENFGQSADYWDLAPFQYEGHDHIAFIKHGLAAIYTLANLLPLQNGVVIFSGSQTSVKHTCFSEAQSYFMLMRKILCANQDGILKCFEDDMEIISYLYDIKKQLSTLTLDIDTLFSSGYITTEEFALDSFQNLLFSIYRFKEFTSVYPTDITIVGFGFKKERFLKYHAKSIDFDIKRLGYISIEPNPLYFESLTSQEDYSTSDIYKKYFQDLENSELKNAVALFNKDWYGLRGNLFQKRESRNAQKRFNGYCSSKLISFDANIPDQEFFDKSIKGQMPWSTGS